MTKEEYEKAIDDLLKSLGGSYSRPSGWLADGLAFSCDDTPITVVNASSLTPNERRNAVRELSERLAKN